MARLPSFLKYWLPVMLWMLVIFSFSTDAGSTSRTSRFIGPALRWLIPDISDRTIARVQYVIRKGGHLTEYAILAALMWRAVRRPIRNDPRGWKWPEAGLVLGLALLFACTDEVHQALVPSRQGRVSDVLIDGTGAALGLLTARAFGRWKRLC